MLIQEDSRQSAKMGLKLLSDEESKILDLLKMDEAIQFDTILRGSGFTVSELSGMLLNLEMSGWLRQLPGNFYVKLKRQQHETEN
jgi:predicted Rossmann fold nucleotide-binding protein DprA/Smf involved in DNA uptake